MLLLSMMRLALPSLRVIVFGSTTTEHPATLTAGLRDQVHCFTSSNAASCPNGALFNARSNVIAQVNVGVGSSAYAYDWNWSDGIPFNAGGGDNNGVGHFRSLANTGVIVRNMLTTTCSTGCANGYAGVNGPATNL